MTRTQIACRAESRPRAVPIFLSSIFLSLLLGDCLRSQEIEPKANQGTYFPPPETAGGWRTLVSASETPSAEAKQRIRDVAGLEWDRLQDAWTYSTSLGGPSSVVVIRHGWIAGEWHNYQNLRGIASCTKSLTSLAVAKLCELSAAGKTAKQISFDSPAWKYLPAAWGEQEPRRKEIAIRHLLTMSSGLDPYDGPYNDLDAYADLILARKVEAEPGKLWAYSSSSVDLLSLIVENVSGQLMGDFFNEQIARPIGSAPLEFPKFREHSGGSGGPKGGARIATRDLARLGYLLLHDGSWRDETGHKQVFSPETVHLITRWAPQLEEAVFREPNLGSPKPNAQKYYGYLIWTNRTQQPLGKTVPADAFYFSGWGKQTCCVIPSLDMVVVRLGPHAEHNNHLEYYPEFLSRIMAGIVDAP
jgi:CubicO group peptidase (beta-lactamase class C family)